MIVNEKGLVKALKSAYKRQGYTILQNDAQITIYTDRWYTRIDRDKFPVKALATIVEHMGTLPTSTDALLISANAAMQIVMPEIVGKDIAALVTGDRVKTVTLVPVFVRGYQLYQEEGGGSCYGVDAADLCIVERSVAAQKSADVIAEDRLEWSHDGEIVIISATRPTAHYWSDDHERDVWAAMESADLHEPKE